MLQCGSYTLALAALYALKSPVLYAATITIYGEDLVLNIDKPKELIVDYRRRDPRPTPCLNISPSPRPIEDLLKASSPAVSQGNIATPPWLRRGCCMGHPNCGEGHWLWRTFERHPAQCSQGHTPPSPCSVPVVRLRLQPETPQTCEHQHSQSSFHNSFFLTTASSEEQNIKEAKCSQTLNN